MNTKYQPDFSREAFPGDQSKQVLEIQELREDCERYSSEKEYIWINQNPRSDLTKQKPNIFNWDNIILSFLLKISEVLRNINLIKLWKENSPNV